MITHRPEVGCVRKKMHGMRVVQSLVVAVLAFVVVAVPSSVALADRRVALVVGNSTYAHIGRLPNPDNNARDMSSALRRLGFEVTTEFDADRGELTEALRCNSCCRGRGARSRGGAPARMFRTEPRSWPWYLPSR